MTEPQRHSLELTDGFKRYLDSGDINPGNDTRLRTLFSELYRSKRDQIGDDRAKALDIVERSIARFVQAVDLLEGHITADNLHTAEGDPDPSDPAAYEAQIKEAAIEAIAGAMQTLYPYSGGNHGATLGTEKSKIREAFAALTRKMTEDRRSANWAHDILVSDSDILGPKPKP